MAHNVAVSTGALGAAVPLPTRNRSRRRSPRRWACPGGAWA